MRTTSLAVLSALSLCLASGNASAQSRLTLNDEDGSTPPTETTRLALARDAAGPILRMPERTTSRRNGLPALRRKPRSTAPTLRGDVRISQIPRNPLPGDAEAPSYPNPPLLRRSPEAQVDRGLAAPEPPPELTGDDRPAFLSDDDQLPTLTMQDDLAADDPPAAEGDPSDGAPLNNYPYQGPTADFFLPPRPCVIHDYWTGYCSEGYGGHCRWLHALGWGHRHGCRTGHCGCNNSCTSDCGCDHGGHAPAPVPEPEVEMETDFLVPPAPRPPRNDLPQVRTHDSRAPRR